MQQIMTKGKSIVCIDTQIHNYVEGNALEWFSEEPDFSDRVKHKQKMTSLQILASFARLRCAIAVGKYRLIRCGEQSLRLSTKRKV